MDFEASSLGRSSYPIEVGLAAWPSREDPILAWSTLIRPTSEWLDEGDWDPASEEVHGIAQVDLARGMPARDAAERVLDLVASLGAPGMEVACDGLSMDRRWWARLLTETPRKDGFVLVSHSRLRALAGKATDTSPSDTVVHRAGPDAVALLAGFAEGLGTSPKVLPIEGPTFAGFGARR